MKNLLILSIMICVTCVAHSQDQTSSFYVHNQNESGYMTNLPEVISKFTLKLRPHLSNTSSFYFGQGDNGSTQIIQSANYNGTTAYRISLNPFGGNLGIGTLNPLEKLHVEGSTSIVADIGVPTNPYWKTGSHTFELQNNDGGEVIMSFHRAGYNAASIKSPVQGGLILSGTGASSNIDVYIDRNNRVGIGTISPDERLTVKGTIHSEEVKVDLSVPGPDYVFESDYNLRSLEETETYIKENKHLPEVPSAKEMEANGVQLGEMNMLLLKKIEELTLHQIELLKKLDKQQSINESLIKRLEKLENQ